MSFKLPKLPYAYDALEPHIDAKTMEIHHSKHHNGYTNKLNNLLSENKMENMSIEEICSTPGLNGGIRNNAGGYYNHNMFWKSMNPNGGGNPNGKIADAIMTTYGSFENFKNDFSKAAATRFGSGWAWLGVKNGKLKISSTVNQDNPIMDDQCGCIPILCIDVWEHAYYLNYQNKRPDYINAFFNVIDWNEVESRFEAALIKK